MKHYKLIWLYVIATSMLVTWGPVYAQHLQFLGFTAPYPVAIEGSDYGVFATMADAQDAIMSNYKSSGSHAACDFAGPTNVHLVISPFYFDGAIEGYTYTAVSNSDPTRACDNWGAAVNGSAVYTNNYPRENDGKPCCLGVGDPINFAAMNAFREESDYLINKWLYIKRYYNSDVNYAGGDFGKKWRLAYDSHINYSKLLYADTGTTSQPPTSGTTVESVQMERPDGKIVVFMRSNGQWISDPASSDVLNEVVDGNGNPTGWTYRRSEDNWIEHYDADGFITGTDDNDGLHTSYSYSSSSTSTSVAPTAGLLISITDPFGRIVSITYDAQSRIRSITLPDSSVISYSYSTGTSQSSQDLLTGVSYPDGKSRSYVYNDGSFMSGLSDSYFNGFLTKIYDEDSSLFTAINFDGSSRPIEVAHAGGADDVKINYSVSPPGSANVTYPSGITANLSSSNIRGKLLFSGAASSCSPACGSTTLSQTFDNNAYPASRTDFDGNITKTIYEANGLLDTQVDAQGTSSQRTTNTTWNSTLRVPLTRVVLDAGGSTVSTTQWVYNNAGQTLARCEIDPANSAASGYACSASGTVPAGVRRWTYTYCTAVDGTQCPIVGLRLTATGPRTDIAQTTSYSYYLDSATSGCPTPGGACHRPGDLHTVTDPLGHVTTYASYDADGRPTRITDANGINTDLTYTPRGWLASRTVGVATTTFGYTSYGAVSSVTDPDGVATTYGYDAAHRLVKVTDAQGNTVQYTLDAAGDKTTKQVFDSNGTVHQSLSRTFNALGELTTVVDGLNHTVFNASAAGSYDANGNLLQSSDGLGIQRQQSYDALNRLVQTIDNYNGTN